MTHELYKKHRPKTLKEVVGQTEAVSMISSFFREDKFPHAVMFSGASGVGKTTLARILKTKLFCSDLDFQEINASQSRGIDCIRDIQVRASLSTLGGKSRIFLLDEAQSYAPYAQQALLKLLEDTPKHVYFFICTTAPDKLLRAINTRCTHIKLKLLSKKVLIDLINKVLSKEKNSSFNKEIIERIADLAEGSAREALVLLDQVIGLEDNEQRLQALQSSQAQRHGIDLARALHDRRSTWNDISRLLEELEDEPEEVRRIILNYASKVVLKGGKMASRGYLVLCTFESAFFFTEKSSLVRACYEIFSSQA